MEVFTKPRPLAFAFDVLSLTEAGLPELYSARCDLRLPLTFEFSWKRFTRLRFVLVIAAKRSGPVARVLVSSDGTRRCRPGSEVTHGLVGFLLPRLGGVSAISDPMDSRSSKLSA